jgi:hypothetical protein
MGPLAICVLICLLPGFLADTVDTLERLGTTPANGSWWPL